MQAGGLLDGCQAEVLVRCLGGQPAQALKFLNCTVLSQDWERLVASCLAVLCLVAAEERSVGSVETMVDHYLALDAAPELAVFRTRVGLAVLDLSPRTHQADVFRRLGSQGKQRPTATDTWHETSSPIPRAANR